MWIDCRRTTFVAVFVILNSLALISSYSPYCFKRLGLGSFEQTTAIHLGDEKLPPCRPWSVKAHRWTSMKEFKWDEWLETHKPFGHWFAERILCGSLKTTAFIPTCSQCGVISRHITTRVFSLCSSSGLSAIKALRCFWHRLIFFEKLPVNFSCDFKDWISRFFCHLLTTFLVIHLLRKSF